MDGSKQHVESYMPCTRPVAVDTQTDATTLELATASHGPKLVSFAVGLG